MAASFSPVLLLVVACCCCWSFVSSGILPGPVRGYETYQHTFSSRQSQSYDSRTGAFQSYRVTSRQCSVIRRVTQYESVRVPFLCQAVTGRVAPLPSRMDSNTVQVLNAMKAGGWSMCYQPITVPIYRYQRIPVCCPGTTPTPEGGCLCRKKGSTVVVPTPGQLLQSNAHIFTDLQDSSHQGYNYLPATSTPIRVQPPRPYRGMLSKVSPGSLKANSLLRQVTLSGARGGPSYRVDNDRTPNTYFPRHPMATSGGAVTEWQGDIARYLATMMYQTLLVEQQQKLLQDEMGRQLRLKQQMDFLFALQQQKRQQQQQRQRQNPWGGPQQRPTFSSNPFPSPQPNPIPSPPIEMEPPMIISDNEHSTTVAPPDMDLTQGVPDGSQPGAVGEGAVEEGEGEGAQWNGEGGGILTDMQRQQDNSGSSRSSTPPMFGNGPRNIPPGAGGIMETKEKVKGIIDSCLKASGFPPMEVILESGDVAQLQPVCRSTKTMGPCVLQAAEDAFGQDQLGMVGRRMMRSVLMSMGHLCRKLDQMDSTSPPVFPNPPPPVTDSVVTKVTGHIISGDNPPATDNINNDNNHQPQDILVAQGSPVMESKPPASAPKDQPQEETMTAGSDSPLGVPAATPSPGQALAHVATKKTTTDDSDSLLAQAAAFPMWMILAMVGACAVLLLLTCLAICLVLRCRRNKKSLELEREPEKLPVPPTESNIYAASPCQPPPTYPTTAVKQTMGGQEEEGMEEEFKIPEDTADDSGKAVDPSEEKTLPEEEEEKAEEKGKEEA